MIFSILLGVYEKNAVLPHVLYVWLKYTVASMVWHCDSGDAKFLSEIW